LIFVRFIAVIACQSVVILDPWRDKGSQKTKKLGDFHSR
jgi:hypothetical protein